MAPRRPDEPGTRSGGGRDAAARPKRTAARGRKEREAEPGPSFRRPALTSRAAILAIVVCAIALSLAYPLREYIAQRRQIAALQAEEDQLRKRVEKLERRKRELQDPKYIEREARRRLHYCYPGEKCYVIVDGGVRAAGEQREQQRRDPWFATLWRSVEAADRTKPRPGGESLGLRPSSRLPTTSPSPSATASPGSGRSPSPTPKETP
ncbi:MAG: septum formation initiator family protein [Streptosporangiales bacterium]|nr:septum formation initiator family protein [Streptosporangiales bacterium]